MKTQDSPWHKGFRDGFNFKEKQMFDNSFDQEEYDKGFFDGRTEYYEVSGT